MENKNKKIIIYISIIATILILVGATYAFFTYMRIGGNNKIVAGDIYLNFIEDNEIELYNVFPETYEEAMANEENELTFEIRGKNTSTKDINYAIKINQGDDINGMNRFLDEHIRIYLECDGEVLVNGVRYNEWDDTIIALDTIEAGTENETIKKYILKIWIDENILISDTAPNSSYTTEEYRNSFASIKVKVEGKTGDIAKPLVDVIEEEYENNLTQADAFGNRYISGTKAGITNNYVKFSDKLWRIVGINADGTIKLITESAMAYMPWDSTGNTDYATSEIHEWLNNEFLNTLDQDQIATGTVNYTGLSDSFSVGEIKMIPAKVGLISAFDYVGVIGADLTIGDFGLMNDNYLLNGTKMLTMSALEGYYYVWNISSGGMPSPDNLDVHTAIRPVVNLVTTTKIIAGEGSKESPYVIESEVGKGDTYNYNNNFTTKLTNLSDADINGTKYVTGLVKDNYVEYSGYLWRVVALNGDGTVKLVAEDTITKMAWSKEDNVDYSLSKVRTWLNDSFLPIIENDIIVETSWTTSTGSVNEKVGMIGLKEIMFASEGTDESYLNDNADQVYLSNHKYDANSNNGVRPSVVLMPDIRIEGGEGTKESPYILKGDKGKKTITLYDKILKNNSNDLTEKDSSGTRFIKISNTEIEDNYVWYSGKLWRIVALNGDGTVKLVTQNNITSIAWDINKSNNYSTSQVRKWLNEEFLSTIKQNLIATSTWDYTGYDSFPTGKLPTTNKVSDKVGLLNLYEYKMTGGTDIASTSNTYLNTYYLWWLMTPYTQSDVDDTTQRVWGVSLDGSGNGDGDADGYDAGSAYGVRPSVNLISEIRISGGEGTAMNPYRLEGDIETGASSEYLNTRISGEYVKFNNTVYRIVGIETINNQKLTKITMADYGKNSNTIDTEETFGNSGVFSKTTGIGQYLNNWYVGLSNTYKEMIATDSEGVKWYQGDNTEYDYTKAKLGTGISATIGLPYYGEMFSTQFGPGYKDSVWTFFMTRCNNGSSRVLGVGYLGEGADTNDYGADGAHGVRPSMYLKSNVKIKDTNGDGDVGNGTANYPYEIAID